MKVIVKEIKKVDFIRWRGEGTCIQEIRYDIYVNDVLEETFYDEANVDKYILYLEEKKNDYEKVIREIEI